MDAAGTGSGAGEVSLRARLLLIFGGIVVVAVTLVSYVVSREARKAFEQFDIERAKAVADQFQREFRSQAESLTLRTGAITRSQQVRSMALALSATDGDPALYLNLAPSLAAEQQLDYLEILSEDGTIISSAQWPAQFGRIESWIAEVSNWNSEPAFLQYVDTPQQSELGLLSVRELTGVEHRFFIVAGRRIDSRFLNTLALPEGTTVFLWRKDAGSGAEDLQDAHGSVRMLPELETVVEKTLQDRAEIKIEIRLNDAPDGTVIAHSLPLAGRDSKQPLAILVVASSRRPLIVLQNRIRNVGLLVALAGIVLSVMASSWWAGRISRPIAELSSAAQDVAAGNWDRKVDPGTMNERDEVERLTVSFNQMTSELLRQRDRAVQAERVAAWRELARRLAHELKNPLFPLQITIENLMKARQQRSPEFDEIFSESTGTLLAELNNLKKIVGRFSDFSKMPAPQWQNVNVDQMLQDLIKLFSPQLSAAANPIKLDARLEAGAASIDGDPDLLRRAFDNLILNAIDAMPAGGTLHISTAANRNNLTVEIRDTGAGFNEEEASRLFTPYYTTKQHGTGLGLAIVQSVISDHGARISVSSRPGEGTTFRMEFQRRPAAQVSGDAFAGKV